MTIIINIKNKLLTSAILLILSMPVMAEGLFQGDKFRVSGFGTLGITSSDSGELGFLRSLEHEKGAFKGDVELKTDSLIGIQVNANLTTKFDMAVQFLVKERVSNNFNDLLELAFIGYRPINSLEFRVGRLQADIYMLSDYKNVGFAYPWVRPNSEFYGLFPFQSYDGFDVEHTSHTAGGMFQVKVFGGHTKIKMPFGPGVWDTSSLPLYGVSLNFQKGNWLFRGGWARLDYKDQDPDILGSLKNSLFSIPSFLWSEASQVASDLTFKDTSSTFTSLGMAYDDGNWLIQSELSSLRSGSFLSTSYNSGYLSVGRRFGVFTPYVIAGVVNTASDRYESPAPAIPSFQPLNQAAIASINGSLGSQHTFSLGTRWDITNHTALKFQWNRTRVSGEETAFWRLKPGAISPDTDQTVNTFSINLDFIF